MTSMNYGHLASVSLFFDMNYFVSQVCVCEGLGFGMGVALEHLNHVLRESLLAGDIFE